MAENKKSNEKRLIDANRFLRETKFQHGIYPHQEIFAEINRQPTVDAVEVVHGIWEVIEASDELYKCSVCGEWQYIPEEHFVYCPYCGAKMDGGNHQ